MRWRGDRKSASVSPPRPRRSAYNGVMDALGRIAETAYLAGLFIMLTIIVGTVARCMRAFIQGINDAEDPRTARPSTSRPLTFVSFPRKMYGA